MPNTQKKNQKGNRHYADSRRQPDKTMIDATETR
jgi:hypothetical protein